MATGKQEEQSVSAIAKPNEPNGETLEAAVDQAIAAAIRALILANDFLEAEVGELMKAVSHAYTRGRFHAYSG